MKVKANDLGICGVQQLMYAGSVVFDDADAATGVKLCELPQNIIVTRAVAVVETAFSSGATITVGTNEAADDIIGSGKVTATTAGSYSVENFEEYKEAKTVKAKLGGTPTAGSVDIYLFVVRIPD